LITRNAPNAAQGTFKAKLVRAVPLWTVNAVERVTNGDFSSFTAGWTQLSGGSLAIAAGQGVLTTTGAGSRFERGVTLEAGAYYRVSMDLIEFSGVVNAKMTLMRNAAGNYATIGTITASVPGKVSFIIYAPATDAIISVSGDNVNAGTVTVDNISIRKLDTFCNPLTLVNTTSPGWQEIEA